MGRATKKLDNRIVIGRKNVLKEKVQLKEKENSGSRRKNSNNRYEISEYHSETIPVRVLTLEDYVSFKSHCPSDIPCFTQFGQDCPYCVANEKDAEKGLESDESMIFAFADLNSGLLKTLKMSKNQAMKLIAEIEEYVDEIINSKVAFNLIKIGLGEFSEYSLNPMTTEQMSIPLVKEMFDKFNNIRIDENFFEERLMTKHSKYTLNLFKEELSFKNMPDAI